MKTYSDEWEFMALQFPYSPGDARIFGKCPLCKSMVFYDDLGDHEDWHVEMDHRIWRTAL